MLWVQLEVNDVVYLSGEGLEEEEFIEHKVPVQ